MTDLINLADWQILKESLNGLMKLTNRMGRGYSFDVIRARILFAPSNSKSSSLRQGIFSDQQGYMQIPPAGERKDFFSGVSISTLARDIEEDHFLPISTRYSE
jgi:transposase